MSTPGAPGMPSQPASGWFPNLSGQGLPKALTNGLQQGFMLIYSLRDAVNQLKNTLDQLIQFGSHLDRTTTQPEAMPAGMLWFESDRQTVFYQTRLAPQQTTRDWFYAGGIYADLFTNRPTDLADRDAGFLFLALNQNQFYRWNGKGWDTV